MCEFVIDCPHFTPKWTDSGFVVIRNQNIRDGRLNLTEPSFTHQEDFERRIKRAKPIAGDIIFTREAPMGEVCLIPEGLECCLGQRQVLLRPKKEIDRHYLFYSLRSEYARHQIFWNEGTGSTVSNVRIPALKSLRIPRLGEVEGLIGALLGALDDKIELNRQTNETLEALARALFKDWFVDFGPTRTKAEGGAPYLAPELWALFPDALDDEDKPVGWESKPLSSFMSFRGGSQPPAKEFISEPKPGYTRLLQIRDFDTDAHITYVPDSTRLRKVSIDDICIGRYGTGSGDKKDSLGRLCRGLSGAINVALVRVEPRFPCREWLATYIGSGEFRQQISGGSARAVQAGFRKVDLDHILIPRAPDEVYQAFETFGELVWESAKRLSAESTTLAQTRDLLLPKLMSGEIRLRDAERAVDAVL
ncbi:restriction endonuclease S subunit [Thiorhodovibrio frisius]|uniref:Restriction endonuclease S subunit n=2 Tax=Thiorhodovibrio frisius TaxID=631362 RepID=H8Z490_9GAMM|nr:restriction endonuclease S subunit [Thiorhodovibrio frisius]WPL20885.1 EcoKI restriction-modification system protein HsdS [Thiorhodovibrio frisius]